MNDEIDLSTKLLTMGGFVTFLLMLWVALLKFMLGRYVKTLEENTTALNGLNVRVARIEGGLGIKGDG